MINLNVLKGRISDYSYDLNDKIGQGSYGTVFQGKNKKNMEVAIKEIIITPNLRKENLAKELEVLKKIEGSYITKYIEDIELNNKIYIIMEYCEDGTLRNSLDNNEINERRFTDEEVCTIIKEVAVAFLNIEAGSMMHRDLKPDNILCKNGHIKIADFGFAKIVDFINGEKPCDHTKDLGSPYYMSPQMLAGEDYSCKTDVWSMGITAYELLFGRVPWHAISEIEMVEKIYNNPLVFEESIEENLEDLVRGMLEIDESKRLSWLQVYHHPALQYIELPADDYRVE